MTSLAEAGREPRKSTRLGRLVLALSLTLNVFFVGGLVWSKVIAERAMEPPAQRFLHLARQLNLNADQQVAFDHFTSVARVKGRSLQETNHPLIEQAWTELEKPHPDEALLSQLFDEASANRRAHQKELGEALRAFLLTLSPEQRATFVDLARRRQDPLAQRIWRVIVP